VIKWEIRVLLRHLLDQGLSKAAIARQVGVNRRTINRWLVEGQLDRDVETGQVPRPVRRSKPTKLDPFKAIIQARLERYPELTAVRLFEELKAWSSPGGLKKAVQILDRRALPGASRVAEEDGKASIVGNPGVLCHLLALIPGQRGSGWDGGWTGSRSSIRDGPARRCGPGEAGRAFSTGFVTPQWPRERTRLACPGSNRLPSVHRSIDLWRLRAAHEPTASP
jgi:transposase